MINPIRLVKDIFDDVTFSDVKLQPFANDHLIRLGNNNPGGIYSQLITDTTIAFTGFYGILTDQATKEAISEGLTIGTNNAKAAVLAKLSSQRDLVGYKFKADSIIYQEFFPHGLTEYQNAKLDTLPNILDRYLVAATAHLTADFPAEVTAIGGLVTAYKNARNAQLGVFSETDTIRTGKRETRKVLTLQLTKNMLSLAIDFLDNPDGFDDYYNAEMLPLTTTDDDTNTDPTTGTATKVSGTAVDQNTLIPLVGVEITLSDAEGSITTTTDADGKYEITINTTTTDNFTANLTATIAGYTPQTRSVTFEPGEDRTEDFQLMVEMP